MSVDTTFYVVNGIRLLWNDKFINSIMDDHEIDGEFIIDGMGGHYIVIGNILCSSNKYEDDDDQFKEIDISLLKENEIEYKKWFVESYPDYKEFVNQPFKLLCFLHYS